MILTLAIIWVVCFVVCPVMSVVLGPGTEKA